MVPVSRMDGRYYELPAGSAGHRAAYGEAFAGSGGIGFPDPGDAGLSYEIDNAYELAAERYSAGYHAGPDPEAAEEAAAEAARIAELERLNATLGCDLFGGRLPGGPAPEPEMEIEPW